MVFIMVDNVLILAGGSGTRLWPASLNEYPKQFIKVKGGKSLLKLTIERALSLDIPGSIIIITLKSQLDDVVRECAAYSDTGKLVILPEPAARNTAPAIAAAAWWFRLSGEFPCTSLILPADHLIEDLGAFRENVLQADSLAREGFLVTFGIPPAYPETGYGYIERGAIHGKGYRVASFREKPDLETAKKFVNNGSYYWNSGMFAFRMDVFLDEAEKYSPAITDSFKKLGEIPEPVFTNGVKIIMDSSSVDEVYKKSPSISIDYAVMEKTERAAMVGADFSWNDIGSWDQFETIIKNLGRGELFEVEASNNIVFSDMPVALCDVNDLIVVIKNGKALICRKGSSQKVKEIRSLIKEKNRKDLL